MATGWAGDGAVQDQIDATVKDGIRRAQSQLPTGAGSAELRPVRRDDSRKPGALRFPAYVCAFRARRARIASLRSSAAITVAAAKIVNCASRPVSFERHFPFAEELQLPLVGRGRAGIQHRHLDAAYRAGLAGADPSDAQQRDRDGRGHGAAVRTSNRAAAADGLCGRSPRPPQTPDRDPSDDGPARARPWDTHLERARAARARVCVRAPARVRHGLRRSGAPDFRLRDGRRSGPIKRGRFEFDLLQCWDA